MISRLRNWWGTLPASSERAPKTSPSASAPLGTAPSVLATPKDEQPNKATVPDGRELFLAASSAEEREQVLKNHPFWQTKDVELQLGVAEVAAVIEHVSELYAKYHFRLSHPRSIHLRDGESRIEDMRGIQWGTAFNVFPMASARGLVAENASERKQCSLECYTKTCGSYVRRQRHGVAGRSGGPFAIGRSGIHAGHAQWPAHKGPGPSIRGYGH